MLAKFSKFEFFAEILRVVFGVLYIKLLSVLWAFIWYITLHTKRLPWVKKINRNINLISLLLKFNLFVEMMQFVFDAVYIKLLGVLRAFIWYITRYTNSVSRLKNKPNNCYSKNFRNLFSMKFSHAKFCKHFLNSPT